MTTSRRVAIHTCTWPTSRSWMRPSCHPSQPSTTARALRAREAVVDKAWHDDVVRLAPLLLVSRRAPSRRRLPGLQTNHGQCAQTRLLALPQSTQCDAAARAEGDRGRVGADNRSRYLPNDRIHYSQRTHLSGTTSGSHQLSRDAWLSSRLVHVTPTLPRLQLSLYHVPDVSTTGRCVLLSEGPGTAHIRRRQHVSRLANRLLCRVRSPLTHRTSRAAERLFTGTQTHAHRRRDAQRHAACDAGRHWRRSLSVHEMGLQPARQDALRDALSLQFYLAHGLWLDKICHVVAFSQCTYMLSFSKFCNDGWKNVQSDFGKLAFACRCET